jgi:hypothetical protein
MRMSKAKLALRGLLLVAIMALLAGACFLIATAPALA